jgi:uncharacterized protein (TIGR04255 family)
MAQPGRYSKPPLVEALLDFQVELPASFAVESLEQCHDKLRADYPTSHPLKKAFGKFEFGDEVTASASSHPMGYRFTSADGLQLFQARPDGFTHNRMAPYLGWEPFRTEARRLWTVYREVAKPVAVKRVAVRYINRIDIPVLGVELKDYLRTSPEVSSDLPQGMAGFFMQVTLGVPDLKAFVTLTETGATPPAPDTTSLVFDLDLFRADELPTDEEGLWALLELFRDKKDAIFEACITDKTRELIR